MKGLFRIVVSGLLVLSSGVSEAASGPDLLIPRPVEYAARRGTHFLREDGTDVRIVLDSKKFRERVAALPPFARKEAYRLVVRRRNVTIEALEETGICRARATLSMLSAFSREISCCEIMDYPRFPYRGLMIDESRSFKGKEFILKQIDAMALLKLNVLHLHLTDAAGWRIRVKSYPALAERAGWRIGRTYAEWEAAGYPFSSEDDPEAYGGCYSPEDLREIVSYAAERHVEVIPEIEMPGHSMEVNRSCPEIACVDEDGRRLTFSWDLCPGNEGTFRLLESVLEEVMDIFPSRYIHIGGDEAVMKDWPRCVNCRKRMEAEGMTHVKELQGYLMRRIAAFLQERGRTAVGWDEILETGVPEDAVVMSWRGTGGGAAAASAGHDVVMCPSTHCYFDYYQDLISKEPLATGTLTSLRHCYGFEPVPAGIPAQEAAHILGLQANLWCEKIPDPEHAEYMLYPRAFAISEIGWTPAGHKSFREFRPRAQALAAVFRAAGYRTFDMDSESERARSRCFEQSAKGYNYVSQEGGPVLSYGWDSGVKIIVADEQGFRDMNGNGRLDPFEDWRLAPSRRADDLRGKIGHETLYGLDISASVSLEELFASGLADNPYRVNL